MRRGKKSTDPQLQTPKKQVSPKQKEKKEGVGLTVIPRKKCLVFSHEVLEDKPRIQVNVLLAYFSRERAELQVQDRRTLAAKTLWTQIQEEKKGLRITNTPHI